MTADGQAFRELPKVGWQSRLAKVFSEQMKSTGRVLLCVTGKTGAGKTTFARRIRKEGLPGIKRSEIAVIDDGVMTAPVFGFINHRVRFACAAPDDLAPFEPYLRGKKVVVYVAIRPEKRISRCDILLRLLCSDENRRQRLVASRDNGSVRYERSLQNEDSAVIPADYYFSLTTD